MIASSNDVHLNAFKEYPDWQSFEGRFELVTVPYLLRVGDEIQIYEQQIPKALSNRHIAPHAIEVAARFAVFDEVKPRIRNVILGSATRDFEFDPNRKIAHL